MVQIMKRIRCNICGGDEFREFGRLPNIATGENFAASGFKTNGEKLVECNKCGLVFIETPIKYPDDILEEYAAAEDKDYISQVKWRIKTFQDSIRQIEDITGLTRGRILDVGAAAGAFVKAAKDRGWHSYGIEPCRYLVRYGKEKLGLGRYLNAGTIDDVKNGKFDVITFWDVLEHTSDPNKTIKTAVANLEKDGYIVTNVPDISSIIPVSMGMRWPFYESAHLFYFTGDTLDDLMRRNGLERVYYSKYWQGLSLGYLAYRFKQFNEPIAKLMTAVINALGLSEMPMKYYIGQSLFVYKLVKRQSK
jgi:SAM-dependent methyltransferase